jgi:D-3-phosphoglycerate dehydrogenase
MKVLVTASFTEEGLTRLRDEFKMEVVYEPWKKRNKLLMSDELAEKLKEVGADAVILEVDLCHEEVFESVPLKFIGDCRGDPLNVDLDEATARKIPVFYTPGRNADAVADLALGFMLCHLRKVIPIHNSLVSGKFAPEDPADFMRLLGEMTGWELGSRTVGIVGLGAIGAKVARRAAAFDARLLGHDPFAPAARFAELKVEKVELERLFRESDIITLHAAVTDDTEGMITAELIKMMKPTALFINLARMELVNEDALYQALKDHKIGGAAIDVFMKEPPGKDERFLALDNVIVTPHIGGATHDVIRHQTDIILDDLAAYLKGEKPKFCANPEALRGAGK